MKVLLVEDDRKMAEYISGGLRQLGHVLDVAYDGNDGLHFAVGEAYDAIIADRMLPGLDGVGLVRRIRAAGVRTPVLFLTALGEIEDRVEGLNEGGDDYLVKPFAFSELAARIAALGRRSSAGASESVLRVADLEVDLLKRRVRRGNLEIILQPTEFRVLEQLMRHSGEVVTRTMLLERAWDFNFDPQTNVVDVHVSRLRRKLEVGGAPQLIHTVRGAGYVLRAPR